MCRVARTALRLRESSLTVSYTSISGPQTFSEFLWVVVVGIKLKAFGELSLVDPDNLGTIGA
jgi:hypothetical protein